MERTSGYYTRRRMNTGSAAAVEVSPKPVGTSPEPSPRCSRLSPVHKTSYETDEEDSESTDNEQNTKIPKKRKKNKLSDQPKHNICPSAHRNTANVQYYGNTTIKAANIQACVDTTSKLTDFQIYGIIISILVVVAVVVGYYFLWGSSYPSLEERKSQLQDTFREIRKQFPTQEDDLWLTLFAGIKKVEDNPSQPSTFLLLHEVEEDTTPKCLAVKMSEAATAFLKATDPSPLKLQGEELGANDSLIQDHGILISEQKENITNHRAVIVFNLHKIPASVAQSFHYFCDEYNPVVQKAVYFFTMSVTKRLHRSATYVAEAELKKLWQQQLETDKLQPLIVRLTTSVMVIKPEKGLTSSCDS